LSGSEFGLSGSIALYRVPAQLVEMQEFTFHCLSASIAQASRFDGKSDGKKFFVILFLIFTVKPDLKLLKSLQITAFFALQIVGLGNL
jgi:hypothetical protein